jgi:hypothetical protein
MWIDRSRVKGRTRIENTVTLSVLESLLEEEREKRRRRR